MEGESANAKSERWAPKTLCHQASLTRTSAALCGNGGRRKVTPERPPHASAVWRLPPGSWDASGTPSLQSGFHGTAWESWSRSCEGSLLILQLCYSLSSASSAPPCLETPSPPKFLPANHPVSTTNTSRSFTLQSLRFSHNAAPLVAARLGQFVLCLSVHSPPGVSTAIHSHPPQTLRIRARQDAIPSELILMMVSRPAAI
jgi:hypothetical protein